MGDHRLWRLRKLNQSVDAELHALAAGQIEVRYLLNGALSYTRQHPSRAEALTEAAAKRAELEREGWMFHW